MLPKIINTILVISIINLCLIIAIVLRILKSGPEIIFYTSGFYLPFAFMVFVLMLIFFRKNYKSKKWLILLINIVTIISAFIFLQKILIVK